MVVDSAPVTVTVAAKPASGSISISVSPTSLPSSGGTVKVTGIVTNIPDGTTLWIYYNGAPSQGSVSVLNGAFSQSIVVPYNPASSAVTDTFQAGNGTVMSNTVSVTVAAGAGISPISGATEIVPGQPINVDTAGHQNVALVVANINGGFFELGPATKNGVLSLPTSLDGGALSLAWFSGSSALRPGSTSDGGLNLNDYGWGSEMDCYVVDTSIYDLRTHPIAGVDFETWINQTWPGALIGKLKLQLPYPVITITDLGPVSPGSETHNIGVQYFDYFSGALLNAVSNPVNFLVTSAGDGSFGPVAVSGGKATAQATGPLSFVAYIGAINSNGTPYTPNTVVSNGLTLA